MDIRDAKLLLNNLLDRIVTDPKTGQHSLPGIITPKEFEALHMAFGRKIKKQPLVGDASQLAVNTEKSPTEEQVKATKVAATDPEPEQTVQEGEKSPPAEKILDVKSEATGAEAVPIEKQAPKQLPKPKRPSLKLNLQSLQYKNSQDPEIKMCLDFGTAMSKAFASKIKDGELSDTLLLKLGYRASNGKSIDIYPVPSSLWIRDDGKIFMGGQAVDFSMEAGPDKNRARLDSLKRALNQGMRETTPFNDLMGKDLNPTDVELSLGDAIILYLGFLTDLACTELSERYGYSRYVRRNFGLPSWAPERREWGENLLKNMLARAQIVADTFHGKWQGGLDIEDAWTVLRKIEELEALPEYLIDQGVTEPLAVASSKMQEDEPFRGLAMVVDVGAGTSDFALFVMVKIPERELFNGFPVLGCNQSLHMAGDTLDNALYQYIFSKTGLTINDPNHPRVSRHLRMQVRKLKEDLFRDGDCIANLINGDRVIVSLEDFLQLESVQRFSANLKDKFNEIINGMEHGIAKHYAPSGLSIILTGGGATLPMVTELAKGTVSPHGVNLRKVKMDLVPEDFSTDAELAEVYLQMAVAVGGCMPHIMDEKTAVAKMDIPTGKFVLKANPITGN